MVEETGDIAGDAADGAWTTARRSSCSTSTWAASPASTRSRSCGADAPETQIVVLTMQDDPAFARAALRAGALGYVLKDAADAELMNAVGLAAEGRTYLNPRAGAPNWRAQPPEDDRRPDNLSPRELEVLRLIALGHTNAEIAESLVLSVRTVESHRAHIQQKIQLATRADLVAYARDHGLLD